MTLFILPICLVMLVFASAMAIYRLFAGPSLLDRILGFDMAAICIIGMIVLLSVYWRTSVFIEILLIFSLLGFVGAVAFVSYLNGNPERMWHKMRKDSGKGGTE